VIDCAWAATFEKTATVKHVVNNVLRRFERADAFLLTLFDAERTNLSLQSVVKTHQDVPGALPQHIAIGASMSRQLPPTSAMDQKRTKPHSPDVSASGLNADLR
jgi:hypothetical protein